MIYKLWMQILAIILAISLPIITYSYYSQKRNLEMLNSLHKSINIKDIVVDYAKSQKQLALLDNIHAEKYKNNFLTSEKVLENLSDIETVSEPLVRDLSKHFFISLLIVFGVGLIFSFLVAKFIVNEFHTLLRKTAELAHKQNEVKNLSAWQQIARSLVHEIRAPIAPIKLLISSMEQKNFTMAKEKFDIFLSNASQLMLEQIAYFEKMIESFTTFAKLPEPKLEKMPVRKFAESLQLKHESEKHVRIETAENFLEKYLVNIDKNLLDRIFVNLIRNCHEANGALESEVKIAIDFIENARNIEINIQNNGKVIPENIVNILFTPKPSTNKGKNFGIGLVMAKKIALDHGGDLFLKTNDTENGVTFTLTLPIEASI